MSKWIHMKQKKTGRKTRKLEEGKEGKMTKPNDDTVYLRRNIMEALKRSDEKMDSYSRKTDEKMESYSRKTDEKPKTTQKKTDERMDDFSRKADEMLEKFMLVTNTVGSQIQGLKSSIVSMQEMNEKNDRQKEKTSSINSTKESRIWKNPGHGRKYEYRSEDNKKEHVGENQGKTVIIGLHSETTETKVTQLLREMINEIGMDFGSARIECTAKPITHAFIHFITMETETSSSGQRTC